MTDCCHDAASSNGSAHACSKAQKHSLLNLGMLAMFFLCFFPLDPKAKLAFFVSSFPLAAAVAVAAAARAARGGP